ncbi:NifU-like protein involved in Fe-S cluster formation [Desulfuromonas soudanensis]|uniref:NifU-like protein involved in Fe-S cluster formation n=1 Tax=Desulfuromonas soudanensis TaxID=1603606 RepID=A0A0M5IRW7_9BACT|nr:nitrogen fixation protein NifQ [Desulfuromonas soudanensis]ALC17274.1 NifU-like protein involved in Fe-S cluster formation [Desulfuromonas soudanensis]
MTYYTDSIRKYAADDRYAGTLPDADGTGEVGLGAEEAGRRLAVRFALRLADGAVAAIRFQVFGCGFTIAACAAAAELAEGRLLEEAAAITAQRIEAQLQGLPEERSYCAELAVAALQAALESARGGSAVQSGRLGAGEEDHHPLITPEDPVYRALMESPAPRGVASEDRRLFASLLAVAAREAANPADALGLSSDDLAELRAVYFPAAPPSSPSTKRTAEPPPAINDEVRKLLLTHVPKDQKGTPVPSSQWLAQCLAARAARPGHLWIAMGLFERPQLTAAIARHLPSLAAANDKGMRWKRYLFREICNRSGGLSCQSPTCGACSDYALCFAPEE